MQLEVRLSRHVSNKTEVEVSSERFLIETVGGPHPGSRIVPAGIFPWPLPEVLELSKDVDYGGQYMKMSEGTATPHTADEIPRVLKAAKYSWVED